MHESQPRRQSSDRPRHRAPTRLAIAVLVIGSLLTAVLVWIAVAANNHDESRLLDLQVRQGATALDGIASTLQTPLASGVEIADVTGGDTKQFDQFMEPYVGNGRPFVSVSLWRLGTSAPQLVSALGSRPDLATAPALTGLFRRAVQDRTLTVWGFLGGQAPRLGYALVPAGASTDYLAYAQSALPANRQASIPGRYGFSDLNFALYLGRSAAPRDLLATTVPRLPMAGELATATVPFGDTVLTIVATPIGDLSGTLMVGLPWFIAIVGAAITIGAALVTEWLVRRRRMAEQLATENRQLYARQRGIAETLQHALLPDALPAIAGMEIGMRYVPGGEGVDVGGDWYDVIVRDEHSFLFVVGDVSGRGVAAATKMAALHHSIRAYAAQGDPPATILSKLGDLMDIGRDGHFATVLCGHVDVARLELLLATAGHLPPLVVAGSRAYYPPCKVGAPVGVGAPKAYDTVRVAIPPGATVLAFTDGLVERRGEDIETGLGRLQQSAMTGPPALEDLLTTLITDCVGTDVQDDTAILGLRWTR